jgi:hypothetical protein
VILSFIYWGSLIILVENKNMFSKFSMIKLDPKRLANLGPIWLGIPGLEQRGTFPSQYKKTNDFRPKTVPDYSSPETNGPYLLPSFCFEL